MVKVYIMDICQLSEQKTAERYFKEMSKERQEKIIACHREKDRLRSLAAGIVMDRGLMDYKLREKEVVIAYGAYGKPCLKEHQEIQFNLSHAGNYAIAGFGDREIGVDIEQIGRNNEKIVSRFFTEEEQKYLETITEKKIRDREFTRIWTRKESFVKAIGKGLSFGIQHVKTCKSLSDGTIIMERFLRNQVEQSIPLSIERQKLRKNQQLKENQKWFFYEYELDKYQIAVCSEEIEFFQKLKWIEI